MLRMFQLPQPGCTRGPDGAQAPRMGAHSRGLVNERLSSTDIKNDGLTVHGMRTTKVQHRL
eukprot:190487-Pyramimonas_sp.AAC.1